MKTTTIKIEQEQSSQAAFAHYGWLMGRMETWSQQKSKKEKQNVNQSKEKPQKSRRV
jgi:hypothetical protein